MPLEQIRYAWDNQMVKSLALYLAIKQRCCMFRKSGEAWKEAKKACGIMSRTTADKHLKRLIEENWIGYNKKSGLYHVNGTFKIRRMHMFKERRAVRIFRCHLSNFRTAAFSAMVGIEVKRMSHAKKSVTDVSGPYNSEGPSNYETGVTIETPMHVKVGMMDHVGMPLWKMAERFDLSKSVACALKGEAKRMQVLYATHRFARYRGVMKGQVADTVNDLKRKYPEYEKRVKVTRNFKNGLHYVSVQVHDLLESTMRYNRVCSFSKKKAKSNSESYMDSIRLLKAKGRI